ncbi:iron-sulfur cluster assembly protein CIA2 [Aspergillus lucknowensis]|uniref:MIP18 family-like domain-containing protein n=1 Tax=Aspergillus lucknowensis TaxID=176173 RepID=A0ABR4LZK3_9EURO
MASEMQNSNPTILDTADLPTRLRPSVSSKTTTYGSEFFAAVLPSLMHGTADPLSDYSPFSSDSEGDGELMEEPIDEQEIYDLISTISDPEHPISLGALAVVSLPDISIKSSLSDVPGSPLRTVTVLITPTITHCSLATVIGLGVRVRLEQSLPPRFRVDVRIKEGTHSTAGEVNKQLADKERVAAALENGTLMGVIAKMLETCQ